MPGHRHAHTGDPQLKTPARLKLRAQVKRDGIAQGRGCERPVCVMPSREIDWNAKRGPWSYVLDEIVPRWLGGSAEDPANVRIAHHRCNSVDGANITNRIRRAKNPQVRPETAARW